MKKVKSKQGKKVSKIMKEQNLLQEQIVVKNAEGNPDTAATIIHRAKISYTPKVSVIIPVYNVEEYLRECLDSVLNQTLKEIEVICVDDGSTDNSLNILKEYAHKDNRITLITQENLHAGVARNAGLTIARGKYLHFLDSDDWVIENGFEILFNILEKNNVDFIKFKNNTYDNIQKKVIYDAYTEIKYIDDSLFNRVLYPSDKKNSVKLPDSPWSGMYQNYFLKQNKIRFDNLKCANDSSFFFKCLSLASSFYVSSEHIVNYRVNNNKSLVGIRSKNFNCQLEQFFRIESYIQKEDELLKKNVRLHLLNLIMHLYNKYISSDLEIVYKQKIFTEVSLFFSKLPVSFLYNNADLIHFSKRLQHQRNCKITVIIPVYNVEKYLCQCLNSVLNQTLKEIEIICVNDGSSDASLDILKNYSNKDSRLVIINRKNKGVSFSRNEALGIAHGKFIAFMDADDYYPNDVVLEKLYKNAVSHNVKICGGSLLVYNGKNEIVSNDSKQVFNKNEFINYENYQYDYGFQRYIYEKDFLICNNLTFPLYTFFEDPVFFVKAMSLAKIFYVIHDYVYVYRYEQKTRNFTEEKVVHLLLGLKDNLKLAQEDNLSVLYDTTLNRIKKDYKPVIAKYQTSEIENIKKDIMDICISNAHNRYKKTKTNAKVSVILPIYNASQYLHECLDSVINQTLKEIEIICVNDGSTDNSLDIIKEYAAKDKRVKYIDKPNAGYGQTMNCGIDLASGEYIGIVEPDDFVKLEMYETLYNKAKEHNLDIVKSGIVHYWSTDKKEIKQVWLRDKSLENRVLNPLVDREVFQLTMNNVTGIYNTDFIKKNHIYFNETPGASYQDNSFWCQVHFLARKMAVIDDFFYMYRQDNENSSCNSKDKAFCIFEEYKLNSLFFEKHPELKSEFIGEFNYKKLKSYFYHYGRIDPKYQFDFLQRFYDEFKKSDKNKEIDYSIMSAYHRDRLQSILKNHKKFYAVSHNIKSYEISSYIFFPYYWLALKCLKKRYGKVIENKIREQLLLSRIDIKNFGNADNDIDVTSPTAKVSAPEWFKNNQGMGKVVTSSQLKNKLQIKSVKDGKLVLTFKSAFRTFNNVCFPVWIDYKSIKIDGKEILSMPISTWHDKPLRYEMMVKNGQLVTVEYEQQPHYYSKQELKDIVLKLNPNSEYVQNNIKSIVNNIYVNIDYKAEELKNIPLIMADYFIPLGAACRPAYWLKKNDIRKCSLPFDWMMNYSFDIVIKAVKFGINNWFSNYSEKETKLRFRHVTDTNNKMISMHAFPVSTDVSNYMNTFKEIFNRRYLRFINILNSKKSVCFICNRSENINELICFIKLLKSLYSQTSFTLINVRHTERDENITCYKLSKNLIIYEINAYDFHMNGNDKEKNPSFWIGNETLWNKICSKLIVKEAKPSKLFSIQKKDSRKIIRLLGIKLTLRNKRKELLNLLQQNRNELITRFDDLTNKHKQLEVKYNTQQQQHQKTIELLNNLQKQLVNMNDKNTENSKIISNNIISNSALLQNDISNILSNINVLNSDLIQNAKNNTAQILSEIMNSSETIKQQILEASLDSKSCVENSLNSLQSEFKQTAESNKSQIVAKIDEVGNKQECNLKSILNQFELHSKENQLLLNNSSDTTKKIINNLYDKLSDFYVHKIENGKDTLEFRTFANLSHCIRANLHKVPTDIDMVVGVPRSGIIPAYMIALFLNKKCCSLDDFLSNIEVSNGFRKTENKEIKNILIVDDSIFSGKEMTRTKEKLAHLNDKYVFKYMAVYARTESQDKVDCFFEIVDSRRVWQWNYLNHSIANIACFDMDGVLCVDPTPEENDDGEKYLNFILNAKPLYCPQYKIHSIVTSRLEKYRVPTEQWLKEHNIQYDNLVMLDLPTAEERRKLGCHAKFKADIYKNSDTKIFVESEPKQARDIALLTGKQVLCVGNDTLY